MKTQGSFQLDCISCQHPVVFSVSDLDKIVRCSECGQKYGLNEEPLKRQLKKFAALCKQIQESEEILGNTAVAVEVGTSKVQVPFKILLTRLKSTLTLQVGDKRLVVTFRTQTTAPK